MKNVNILISLTLLMLLSGGLTAQTMVSGTITDSDFGDPLIGANVVVKGSTVGTSTDLDGNFTLEVPDDATTLVISYTGYTTTEYTLDGRPVLLALSEGSLLDEVVVIGYGTVKREDATGSVVAVGEDQFNRGAISSPQELLAGKIAGVQITSGGGAPGAASNIRIRGGSSLSASNDPLIVVDGVPLDNGEYSGSRNQLNAINPNDIETFTVLKDASATAIYGSRASNGVILITTKKGSISDRFRVGYTGNVSSSSATNRVEVLGADAYRDLISERFGEGSPELARLGTANTNWQDEIYRSAIGHEHNLSFSGAVGETLPYRLSLGYADRQGIVRTDKFNRTTVGLNLNPSFLDNHLQINAGLKTSFTNNNFADADAVIAEAIRFDPTQPVRVDSSEYGGFYTWLQPNGSGDPITIATANPVARLEQRTNEASAQRYIANFSADYRMHFLPELRANLTLGLDKFDADGTIDVPTNAAFEFLRDAEGNLAGGRTEVYSQARQNRLLDFYLNYVKDIGGNRLDLMAGYSWQHFERDNFSAATRKGDPSVILTAADTTSNEYYLASLFGRANFHLNDDFLFTFTVRRDGTSRFSPENRWGIFPAAAVAWKVIDNSSATSGLSSLKLRLGWGVTGQQAINDTDFYPYLPRYQGSQENANYQLGEEFVTTLRPNGYDANIKWEETTTYNLGVDYELAGGRVYGSVDVYQRNTEDLINFVPVPAGSNLTNFINTNVGDLENRGIEFAINTIPYQSNRNSWELGFNIAANSNKITRLTANEDPSFLGNATGGISGGVGNNIQINSVGMPANSFFVYEQVYDASGNPLEGVYVDQNKDGVINSSDLYHFNDPAPDMSMGLTSALNINKLRISTGVRSNVGNYVYNNVWSDNAHFSKLSNSAGYNDNVHIETQNINFNNPQYLSDHFVQDASFVRVDHITLGYDLGDLIGERFYISASVQNPIVITNYEGIDPEIFVAGDKQGIDNNFYPRPRTYTLGLSVDF